MGITCLASGYWAGGRDALAKAKSAAPRRVDKIAIDNEMAAAAGAQRDTDEALRVLDAAGKTDGAQASEISFVPVWRATTLVAGGRGRQALAPIEAALKMADGGQLPPAFSRNLRREALRVRIAAEAQIGDGTAAEKTSAALDQEASSRADDPDAQTAMHYGRGQLVMTKGDVAGARAHFEQCSREDEMCKWQGVMAAEKAKDAAGAAAARQQLLKVYGRDPVDLLCPVTFVAATVDLTELPQQPHSQNRLRAGAVDLSDRGIPGLSRRCSQMNRSPGPIGITLRPQWTQTHSSSSFWSCCCSGEGDSSIAAGDRVHSCGRQLLGEVLDGLESGSRLIHANVMRLGSGVRRGSATCS